MAVFQPLKLPNEQKPPASLSLRRHSMSNSPTIILSLAREEDPTRRATESALLDALAQRAAGRLIVTPHVYDLAADGPAADALRAVQGDLLVLGWISPRALYWTVAQLGVRGTRGPGWPGDMPDAPSSPARTIWCIDLDQYPDAAACLARLDALLGPPAPQSAPVAPLRPSETARPRWYPVIDSDRCVGCLECLNFCLFGVFGLDASESVRVEQPDACRPGCPACARVCPSGAIMFPEHADPAIAGQTDEPPARGAPGLVSLSGGPVSPSRDRSGDDEPDRQDELDRLVDGLDDLAL